MSTIRLKKDHEGRKAGETISVPWLIGKQLVADGIADRPEPAPRKRSRAAQAQKPALRPQDSPTPARGEPPTVKAEPEGAEAEAEAEGYEAMHVDELHKLASERNIEGRSALTTKADLIKALEKDDKAKSQQPSQAQQQANRNRGTR